MDKCLRCAAKYLAEFSKKHGLPWEIGLAGSTTRTAYFPPLPLPHGGLGDGEREVAKQRRINPIILQHEYLY